MQKFKYLKFSSFFIVLFSYVSISWGQSCADMFFPYQFEPGGQVICTNNPQVAAQQIGKKVDKWPFGNTVNWSINADNIASNSSGCVDAAQLKSCVEQAWRDWTSICPTGTINQNENDPGSDNTIPIDISMQSNDFTSSTASGSTLTIFDNNGDPVLNDGVHIFSINLNYTSNYPFVLSFPCSDIPLSNCLASFSESVNLCAVIRHEIGHVFGLKDESKFVSAHCPGTNTNDLMSGDISSGCEDKDITDNDKCYFCKLYCPGTGNCPTSSVKQDWSVAAKIDFSVFPNPATKNITVKYSAPEKVTRLIIYDITGKIMKDYEMKYPSLQGKIDFDVSSLSSASYIIQIQTEHAYLSRLLLIGN